MPKAKSSGNSNLYRQMQSISRDVHEDNDCVVKLVALVLRVPYIEAHELCKAYGRKDRHGMYNYQWRTLLADQGVDLKQIFSSEMISQYPKGHRDVLKNVTTHHPERFNKVWKNGKRYILVSKGHVSYVENGELHDWARGRALRVHTIWQID